MPDFRHRLTRAQQRVYDRSNTTSSIRLRATARLHGAVATLPEILRGADLARIGRAAQLIADEIALALRVSRVRVLVHGIRPSNARGELHGLYTPASGTRPATITVWAVTAKRRQIVAFKTFLRTLLHEICHHLDYALLRLPDSFHTDGFYQRESSLFHQIGGAAAAEAAPHEPAAVTGGGVCQSTLGSLMLGTHCSRVSSEAAPSEPTASGPAERTLGAAR